METMGNFSQQTFVTHVQALTTGPGQLKLLIVPILQYDSRTSSDFLAKI
jgi:hypothetical protein